MTSTLFTLFALVLSNFVQVDDKKKQEIATLIKDLGAEDPETRTKAEEKLIKIGKVALPLLKKALEAKDEEIKQRAKKIIEEIENVPKKIIEKFAKERWPDDEPQVDEIKKGEHMNRLFPKVKFFRLQNAKSVRTIFAFKDGDDKPIRLGGSSGHSYTIPSRMLAFIKEQGIVLANENDVYDLLDTISDLFLAQHSYRLDSSSVDKTSDGWSIYDPYYGRSFSLKTDSKGKVIDASSGRNSYSNEDYQKETLLRIEKLKLEIEILKHQLKALEEKEMK